jgi:TonB family protein
VKVIAIAAMLLSLSAGAALSQQQSGDQTWYYCPTSHKYYVPGQTCEAKWQPVAIAATDMRATQENCERDWRIHTYGRTGIGFLDRNRPDAMPSAKPPAQCESDWQQAELNKRATDVQQAYDAQQAAAKQEAERDAAAKQQANELFAVAHTIQAAGYRWITVKDFKLDGDDMAHTGQKVMLVGTPLDYVKIGNAEYIFPSQSAAMAAQGGAPGMLDSRIGLLTKGSDRPTREYFYDCNANAMQQHFGCGVFIVAGTVVPCIQTNLLGSNEQNCISVERIVTRLNKPAVGARAAVGNGSPNGQGDDYLEAVRRWVTRYKKYPEEAVRQKQEGVVQLGFKFTRDGAVLDAWIEKSSGFPLLDQAALAMIRAASPIPKVPDQYKGDTLTLVMPEKFTSLTRLNRPAVGAQAQSALSAQQKNDVKAQIEACWNIPSDVRDAQNPPAPEFRVVMRRDGTVESTQLLNTDRMTDPLFQAAVLSANRALLNPRCQPLKFPQDKFEQWRNFTVTFDAKDPS